MVKVTDSWAACHEFESSTPENLPCKGVMHVKSVEAEKSSRWWGVKVWRWGVPAQVSSSSLDHGSKLRDLSPYTFK
ncbi:hypothetical protein TNCV_871141 [Trichonephila clavipes]|nr:hypothetical protein TNCV_871141 [Trichonephila clavipes]